MTEELVKQLKEISWDSLDAKSAIELRTALKESLANADEWFAQLADQFGYPVPKYTLPVKPDNHPNGRHPEPIESPPKVTGGPPVKSEEKAMTPARRPRGRPMKTIKVKLRGGNKRPPPSPINVGGADSETEGPPAAQIFQQSYVSKDGPRDDVPVSLPPDHPRRSLNRESSVTPEVDMSDFHLVEEAIRHGKKIQDNFN